MFRYIVLFLIAFPFALFGKTTGSIYLVLNGNDCSNCLKVFSGLEKLHRHNEINLLFRETYRNDSAELAISFLKDKKGYNLLFSDSLYTKFKLNNGVGPNLTYLFSDKVHFLKFPFSGFTTENIDFLNRINNDSFSINLPTKSYSFVRQFRNSIWLTSGLNNREISIYDFSTAQLKNTIRFDDSFLTAFYVDRFPGSINQLSLLREKEVPQIFNVFDFSSKNDTVYFTSMLKFVNEKVGNNRISTLNVIFKFTTLGKYLGYISNDPNELYTDSFLLPPVFTKLNDSIVLGGLIPRNKKTFEENNIQFLGKYRLFGKNLQFEQPFLYRADSSKYKDRHNLTPLFYQNYFMLALDNKIMQITDGKAVAAIPMYYQKSQNLAFNNGYFREFRLKNEICWAVYADVDLGRYYFIKYDLKNEQIIAVEYLCEYKQFDAHPSIADFNFDYIMFAHDDKIEFRKVF